MGCGSESEGPPIRMKWASDTDVFSHLSTGIQKCVYILRKNTQSLEVKHSAFRGQTLEVNWSNTRVCESIWKMAELLL